MVSNGRIYTAEAAEQIGVSKNTLLRWLTQRKINEVARDIRGWRVFTQSDIERIRTYANTLKSPEAAR